MDAKGQLIVEQTAATIALPLWDFDDSLVAKILDSLLDIDDFARVTIFAPDGAKAVELMSAERQPPEGLRTYSQEIIINEGSSREELGTLEFAIATSGLWTALQDLAINKALLALTIFGFASGALYVVLGHVSKPLTDLRNAIHAIEREEFSIPVPSLDRADEIGALANALDGLREREAELAILRRANTEKSRRESKRILQALHATRDAVVLIDELNNVIFTNSSARAYFPEFSKGSPINARQKERRAGADGIAAALLSRREIDTEISIDKEGANHHFQARTGQITDSAGNDLGGLFLASDFTVQFQHSKKASYLASHDPLTGLLNRREMDSALAGWVADASRMVGVMLLDLDHFKSINDTFGHQNGDTLLVKVAERLRKLCGPDDLVIRLGGDEFAILTRVDHCERHLDWIAATATEGFSEAVQLADRSIHVSMSAGIATTATAGRDVQTLLRHADLALYEAKTSGRGCHEIYKDALLIRHERRRQMEDRFEIALQSDNIYPVFQVQTAVSDGCVVGFETLARWNDPELGFVSPAEFIPLAENADMIEPLTRKILTDACETAIAWRALGFSHRIAVNISPNLFNGAVVKLVQDCLQSTGCPAEWIELEITETVLLPNLDAVIKEIDNLRSMGLTIALDDFGIGYSSLDYLRKYPVDKIKIDRAFVREIASSAQSRAIVTAISQLGHSLGMQVTGEGAETDEDRAALKGCGVDVVQGFVDGQPAVRSQAAEIYLPQPDHHQAAR